MTIDHTYQLLARSHRERFGLKIADRHWSKVQAILARRNHLTVTINKTVYVVDEINNAGSPEAKADMAARGWTGYALIRRVAGRKQYLALINENNGHASVVR